MKLFTATEPLEVFAIDKMGEPILSKSGKIFLLAIADQFSNSAPTVSLKGIKTTAVLHTFEKY